MGVYLTGVYLMGVYTMGVYLMGVHPMGVYLMGVHLTGVHLMGVHLIWLPNRLKTRSTFNQFLFPPYSHRLSSIANHATHAPTS